MAKASQVIVLAEDAHHQRFANCYLRRLGYSGRVVRREPLPSGRGSGEQWVRERYAKEIAAYRQRSKRANTILLVLIDADGDVEFRIRQLRDAMEEAKLVPRADGEKIAHFIPNRSIETWVLCLNGETVDEVTDYSKRKDIDDRIRTAAETFFAWSRPNSTPPDHCIPSLQAAIPEARRIG